MSKRSTKRIKLDPSSSKTSLAPGTSSAAFNPVKKGKKKDKKRAVFAPLGTTDARALFDDDAAKDDEERQLEATLFGVPYISAQPGASSSRLRDDDDEDDEDDENSEGGGRELENMLDTDLFFTDENTASNQFPSSFGAEMLEGDQASVPPPSTSHDTDTQGDSSETGGSSSSDEDADVAPTFLVSSNRKPAWTDPDDTSLQVSLAASNRLRKLRDAPDEDAVGGREYERRLRRQFERLNPTPAWATRSKSKTKLQQAKRKRLNAGSDVTSEEDNTKADDEEGSTAVDETEDFELDDVLASTHLLKSKRKAGILQKGTLNISRLRDANISALPEGSVKSVLFHPSPAVPLLAVTSSDRRVRLFNIDGHTNPHLQTLHFPELPVNTTTFHPAGRTVLLTGPRPFFCTYDLGSGAAVRSPRGLWGNAANAANGMGRGAGREDLSMETVAFSPDGSVLAVAGRGGVVHLVDWNSGGAQVVGSVKMNRPVKSLWWSRSREGKELMTMSEDAEVYIWDVGERRCVRKWKDEGAYGGRLVEGDQAGRYLAIGATTGFVSLYGADASTASDVGKPKSLKTFGNLTTSITSMRFNHDAQLLAIASDAKKDNMRMIHLPSMTAFSNWPNSGTPLGIVNTLDFSPGSEYVAVGNARGRVGLWQIRDFAS